MTKDPNVPIHAICPGCGEPSQDLLAHAPQCSAPEALDTSAGFDAESMEITAAIREVEFKLKALPADEAAAYASRLATLCDQLHRPTYPSTNYRNLLDVLRERRLLLDG
jgi:hypothetical protein